MSRIEKEKLKDISNSDLFMLFSEYLEKVISHDLESIYDAKAHLLDSDEPWMFQLERS